MNIPIYRQGCHPDTWNKWYCLTYEYYRGQRHPRYLHPNGWQPTAYYWDTKQEVETLFDKIGHAHLPVTKEEYQDELHLIQSEKERNNLLNPLYKKVDFI